MIERARPETCLSDLRLDRIRVGELAGDAHLAECAMCSARLEVLRKEDALFLELPWLAKAMKPRRNLRPIIAGVSLLAAGVAAAILFVPPQETTRTKGGFAVTVIARHQEDGELDEIIHGDQVHPGDDLRFKVSSEEDGYVVIAGLDAAGRVSVYYPQSAMSPRVAKGKKVVLEGAITTDATLGAERIIAVSCDSPVAVATVVSKAEAALSEAKADPKRVSALELGCRESTLVFEKVDPK